MKLIHNFLRQLRADLSFISRNIGSKSLTVRAMPLLLMATMREMTMPISTKTYQKRIDV